MADEPAAAARPERPFGRALHRTANALAIFGGILSCIMAVVVTVSVIGRFLFAAPISGDYDIVGILCGSAIFSFLPYCQLQRGNVLADFFTQNASPRTKAVLDAGGNVLFLAATLMFTWRLYYGMLEMRQSSEQIAAFAFYRWWTMPYDLVCMIVLALAILYSLLDDLDGIRTRTPAEQHVARGE